MPVRSLNSSILRWPNRSEVDQAVRRWLQVEAEKHPGVLRAGYFGSYANGSWGVGSDLDLVIVIDHNPGPFEKRSTAWDTTVLPVPADLLIYSEEEWIRLAATNSRFSRVLSDTAVWIFP